jgi:hypothetical protein
MEIVKDSNVFIWSVPFAAPQAVQALGGLFWTGLEQARFPYVIQQICCKREGRPQTFMPGI